MPLQATSGAASYDAFGGGVAVVPNYIESCFSTWLYTGNGSTQTINNGIDLAGEGGLVWFKQRTALPVPTDNLLYDTNRGGLQGLVSNTTDQQGAYGEITFNTNGVTTIGGTGGNLNRSDSTYVSWTFRKQPKFFDVVTWTGDGAAQKTIAHNLGSAPGFIIAKSTSDTANWTCYHRSLGEGKYIRINTTGAAVTSANAWININANTFDAYDFINQSGSTYVAYVFAHNAGGFGLTGTDNVISCGSFTASGSGGDVNLGYEPQWVMIKRTDSTGSWRMLDIMRGYDNGDTDASLFANTSAAETFSQVGTPFANGFTEFLAAGTYIYIAIRRGPMRTPTTGTSVFAPVARTGTGSNATVNVGFPPDLVFETLRSPPVYGSYECDRLRGSNIYLTPAGTGVEASAGGLISFDAPTGSFVGNNSVWETSGYPLSNWAFKRAPGFFDEVCYTGTGAALTLTHNLAAVPELIIWKSRTSATNWIVYSAAGGPDQSLILNTTGAFASTVGFWGTGPTSSTFSVGSGLSISGRDIVTYLFASCPGVSKVFNYTGNGSSQTINCGFTGGARFVMIKRTDSTGDWYVWDTARGIVANNDPHLSLNSAAAEVTTNDTIDTDSTGFVVNQVAATNVNVSSATYIGLAIA